MRKLLTSTCLLLILISSASYASIDQHIRQWSFLQKIGAFQNKRIHYLILFSPRLGNDNSIFHQAVARVAIGYDLTNRLTIWLGTDSVTSLNSSNKWSYEQRIWPQTKWIFISSSHFQASWRSRLEARFMSNESGTAARWRNRIRLAFTNAINGKITPIIFDELFLNINHPSWVGPNTLNQNRFFIGIQFKIHHKVNCLIGYLNQFQWRNPRNSMTHVLYIAFIG